MSAPRIDTAVLTLPTLLRINAAIGAGFGCLSALLTVVVKWRDFSGIELLAILPGALFFNTLALLFATLVGYWLYRWLAERQRWSLHHLHTRPTHPHNPS
ncbi:MAG: hypothetical protein AB7S67_10140 [Thiomonas sp.]